jgi:hypothetical protein
MAFQPRACRYMCQKSMCLRLRTRLKNGRRMRKTARRGVPNITPPQTGYITVARSKLRSYSSSPGGAQEVVLFDMVGIERAHHNLYKFQHHVSLEQYYREPPPKAIKHQGQGGHRYRALLDKVVCSIHSLRAAPGRAVEDW